MIRLSTADPRFDPTGPISVNGYDFAPAALIGDAESIQAPLYEPTPRRWGRALVAAAVLAVALLMRRN